jgi:integrase
MSRDIIEDFLSNYNTPASRKTYKTQLNKFFNFLKVNPNEYFSSNRDYKKDVDRYWDNIKTLPPKSRTTALSVIKMFLFEHEIEFPGIFWRKKHRRAKGKGAVTQDKIPTANELKQMLQHCKSIQSKAFFLTLASSGMRVGEAISLKLDDIDLNKTPARIYLSSDITKSGENRVVFITNEAKDVLKEYLTVRDELLALAVTHSGFHEKKKKDDRLFPFSYTNAVTMWNNILRNSKKNEQDKITNRYKFHIHCLRKFFRSRMGNKNGIGVDMTEFLMGHEGYLTREYRNYTEEELGEEYLKGADRLLIFEHKADDSDIREQLKEKDRQIQELKDQMQMLMAKVLTQDDKEKVRN